MQIFISFYSGENVNENVAENVTENFMKFIYVDEYWTISVLKQVNISTTLLIDIVHL